MLFTYFIALKLLLKPLKKNESKVINKIRNIKINHDAFLKLSIKIGMDINTEKNIFDIELKYINRDVFILFTLFLVVNNVSIVSPIIFFLKKFKLCKYWHLNEKKCYFEIKKLKNNRKIEDFSKKCAKKGFFIEKMRFALIFLLFYN